MSSPHNSSSQATDFTLTGSVVEVEREHIWIEADEGRAKIYASELMLDVGETPADRYAVGDHFEAFVFRMEPDPESGAEQFSIRRAQPYPEALARLDLGAVVRATVVNTYDLGIELDIDGVRGNALIPDLVLKPGNSPHDEYRPGDAMDVLVAQVHRDSRTLYLSLRRNAPGYLRRLDSHEVGDVVSAVVTNVPGDGGGLWLDVDGVVGTVSNDELSLESGESSRERYAVGDTVEAFILQVDRDARELDLSLRRNAPGYLQRLDSHEVGDVVSAVVTSFQSDGGLWADVNGVAGSVANDELMLESGESSRDRYAVGDTIEAFIWQVDRDVRDLDLSLRRNAPGYLQRLKAHDSGDVVSGSVTLANRWGLWLDVDGLVAWIPATELPLAEGQKPTDSYRTGDSIQGMIWRIDLDARDIIVSVRRLSPEFTEQPLLLGRTVDAVVQDIPPTGVSVLVANFDVFIPPHELSTAVGGRPRFERGKSINAVVTAIDADGKPALSHRRALQGWEAEVERLRPGVLIPNARVLPQPTLTDSDARAVLDLGPIDGVIAEDEMSADAASNLTTYGANREYPVVVLSMDPDRQFAVVSHEQFDSRWRELATEISLDSELDAELRAVTREWASLDLGTGLLGLMPTEQIEYSDTKDVTSANRVGETLPVRVKEINPDQHDIRVEHRDQPIEQLIKGGESDRLEFKATLRNNYRNGKKDPTTTFGVMKSIPGFLNSRSGGTLIVGVGDNGKPIIGSNGEVGVLAIDGYDSEDEMLLALKDLIRGRIDAGVFDWLAFNFVDFRGTRILRVDCMPASREIWLKGGRNGRSKEVDFYLRISTATHRLEDRELVDYTKERFWG